MNSIFRPVLLATLGLLLSNSLLSSPLSAQSSSAPAVINKPLPARFFNEDTMLLARIDVQNANIERVFATVASIVPSDVVQRFQSQQQKAFSGGPSPPGSLAALATLRQLADNPSIVTQLKRQRPSEPLAMADAAAKELLSADIRSLYVVLMRNGSSAQTPSLFFLSPRKSNAGGADAKQRLAAFTKSAQMLRAKVSQDGAWLIASASELPRPGDDFGLDEDAFLEALQSNPLHDFMVAFVPTQEMRDQARQGWDEMVKNSPPEERSILPLAKQLIQLLDGDWFYFSAQLGDQPALRLSGHFADSAKPRTMSRALNELIDAMPGIAPVKPSANPTIQKIRQANAKVQFQLFQFLKFKSQETFLTCDIPTSSLKGLMSKILEFQNEPADNSPSSIDPTANFGK